jgi:acyl carrier protein
MIPSAFVFLDTLPLTASGKVDLQALPKPDQTNPGPEAAFVAPRTPTEMMLAGMWAQVLGVDRVSVYDNFFDLGGHSLLSLKVVHRVEKELGLRINPRELVIHTLGQLAATCEERRHRMLQARSQSFTQRLWNAAKRAVFHRM